MQVGIIGAGRRARALARLLAGSGVEAVISGAAEGEELTDLLQDFPSQLRLGALMEAAEPELVILALPWSEIAETVRPIADWGARTVIDACNRDPGHTDGEASSALVTALLTDARVVKAFNAIPIAALEGGAAVTGGSLVIFYSGDHARPKTYVARLIEHLGFCAIDLGSLAQGRHLQEPGGSLFDLRLAGCS